MEGFGTENFGVLFFLDVRHGGCFALDFKFHLIAGEGESVGAFLVVVVGGTGVLRDDVPQCVPLLGWNEAK